MTKVDLKHFRRTVKTDWAKEAEQMKEISMDFFRDEVRNGFFIPTAVKQAWAAQLQVLDVIETICRKHDMRTGERCLEPCATAAMCRGTMIWISA